MRAPRLRYDAPRVCAFLEHDRAHPGARTLARAAAAPRQAPVSVAEGIRGGNRPYFTVLTILAVLGVMGYAMYLNHLLTGSVRSASSLGAS